MPGTPPAPPALARLVLRAILPADTTAAVLQDLDDEFSIHIAPHRSRVYSLLWYWRQVLGSLLPALWMRRRRRLQHDARRHTSRRPQLQRLTHQVWQDLAFAMRFLRRRPGFAAAAMATFALGIGMNTAIFSIVDGVLLRPLPYRAPDRLVRIWSVTRAGFPGTTSRRRISLTCESRWRERGSSTRSPHTRRVAALSCLARSRSVSSHRR